MKKIGVLHIVIVSIFFLGFLLISVIQTTLVYAAVSPWTQTDWSGGSGQTNWSDATRYDSASNVNTSNAGEITLVQTSNWYDETWSYRRQVTFNNADQAENLTDFPVLIKLNSSRIDYSQTQNEGQDIRFTDSDGTTLLSYEIESWNESGDSFVWVKVPQIDASSTTDSIYMYYGNPTATDNQSPTNVWDSNYELVYHLKENPAGSAPQMTDSTSNNNDGTSVNFDASQQVTGQMNGSLDFDGINDYVNSNLNTHFASYTFEGWVNLDSMGENNTGRFIDKRQAGTEILNFFYDPTNGNHLTFIRGFSVARGFWATANNSLPLSTWVYLTVSYNDNPAINPTIYINGQSQPLNRQEAPSGTPSTNADNYIIGNRGATDRTMNGRMDEFRMSNTIRSTPWIRATYLTQNDTFNTYGSEVGIYSSTPGVLTSSIFDTEQESNWGDLTFTSTVPSNTSVAVRVRTSDSSSMSGATAFSSCDPLTSGSDISANNCVTDEQQYVQYQVTLSNTDSISTPVFENISIGFSAVPTPTPTPTSGPVSPTGTSSQSSGSQSQSSSASSCTMSPPGSQAPQLYAAVPQGMSSIMLSFTDASEPYDHYVLEYGTASGIYQFGADNIGEEGTRTYTVQGLNPSTTYYFRIRGGNGCAVGPWSNEISGKTQSLFSTNTLDFVSSELTPSTNTGGNETKNACEVYTVKPNDTLWEIAERFLENGADFNNIIEQNKDDYPSLQDSNTLTVGWELKLSCEDNAGSGVEKDPSVDKTDSYDVNVKVTDELGNSIEGATVTMHSTPRTAITDKDGVAVFEDVEKGDHRVIIEHDGFEGEQSISLDGDVKTYDLDIKVKPSNPLTSPLVIVIISVLTAIIILLVILLYRQKRSV